jgi:hypothetical protein
MQPTDMLLAQALSFSGLVGASGAYAGIVRRRIDRRVEAHASADASEAAVERVQRSIALSKLERTFTKSAYRRHDGGPEAAP